MRIGTGFDVHRLVSGRPLLLAGIEIPYSKGLQGHSDADVVLHAVGDALLGAAALGDLGAHFPPGDPQTAGIASSHFLERIMIMVGDAGWRPGNLDCTVIAEQPRLAPHLPRMRAHLAGLLGLPLGGVSIKATTTEGLGSIGRGEGIATQAVVLLQRV